MVTNAGEWWPMRGDRVDVAIDTGGASDDGCGRGSQMHAPYQWKDGKYVDASGRRKSNTSRRYTPNARTPVEGGK